jgi:hypothetical protein
MLLESFRHDEADAWEPCSEAWMYWERLEKYGLTRACSFADSLDAVVQLCRGTTGLSVPTNYYKQRIGKTQFICLSDSLCSLRKKQRGQRSTPQSALESMGSSGASWSDWKMVVRSGLLISGLYDELLEHHESGKIKPNCVLGALWAATDWDSVAKGKLTSEEVFDKFRDFCVLLSTHERPFIGLCGSAHEWQMDIEFDEYMLCCKEIAESFGILVHNFMTIIPVLERHVSIAGNVDPWHFSSTDANKNAIATVLYKIITAVEMLKPSIPDYDFKNSHAWTCPNLQVQCPC